jgi:hypothetical protein
MATKKEKKIKKVSYIAIALAAHLLAGELPKNQEWQDYSVRNSGITGLMETPNARVLEDWGLRPNISFGNPFVYYGTAVSPLPRTEINLRITQVRGAAGFRDSAAYGDYKDKAIDFKFLLSKESDIRPAIAIGLDDITGTALFASKYIVSTKRYRFLDFSLGYAMGRLGGENLTKTYGLARDTKFLTSMKVKGGSFFGGAEIHATPDITIKAEYSPINYNYDDVNVFTQGKVKPPKSKLNFGLNYAVTEKFNIAATFERGNSLSFAMNMKIPFGKEGLYTHEPDPKWRASEAVKERFESTTDKQLLAKMIATDVAAEKMSNVDIELNKNKIWIGIENPRYNSDAKAVGRTIDTVDEVAPSNIDTFYVALKHHNINMSTIKINREDVKRIKYDPLLSREEISNSLTLSTDTNSMHDEFLLDNDNAMISKYYIPSNFFTFLYKPSLQTFLNAKDNPFVYRFTMLVGGRIYPWTGAFMGGRMRIPIVNSTDKIRDKTLEPDESATRTDVLKYLQYKKLQMEDFGFTQIAKLGFDTYARASIGYFEAAYGGYGAEVYKQISGGRYGVGIEYQKVNKREVDKFFAFKKQKFEGKFLNLYGNLIPELGISATMKIGKFFAGDSGYRLDLSRKYKGFTVGVWLAKTNTNVFQSPENRNYTDKGVFLMIPLSVVSKKDVAGQLAYSLSAWTRDVAQFAYQPNSLVGLKTSNIYEMTRDLDSIKE